MKGPSVVECSSLKLSSTNVKLDTVQTSICLGIGGKLLETLRQLIEEWYATYTAIGRGSLRLTRVGVVVDVGVCAVSVAVLGETDSTAICQLRSQIDAARLSGKPRRRQPRSGM